MSFEIFFNFIILLCIILIIIPVVYIMDLKRKFKKTPSGYNGHNDITLGVYHNESELVKYKNIPEYNKLKTFKTIYLLSSFLSIILSGGQSIFLLLNSTI